MKTHFDFLSLCSPVDGSSNAQEKLKHTVLKYGVWAVFIWSHSVECGVLCIYVCVYIYIHTRIIFHRM